MNTRDVDSQLMRELARRYVWWKTPDDAIAMPERVIARVMNIGDWDDVLRLSAAVGDDLLREVLIHAEIGQFSPRSWHFWHYRLGLAKVDEVPPLPARQLE